MENYKIKVNDESESKEVRSLLENIGIDNVEYTSEKYPCWIATWNGGYGDYRFGYLNTDRKRQELTIPQLRDLVAQSKNEQGLISGADAKLAWAKGENVEVKTLCAWLEIKGDVPVSIFDREDAKFRLKPRTITLSIEIPAPFEPKDGDKYYYLKTGNAWGFTCGEWCDDSMQKHYIQLGAWRTEEEIKQVVAALRNGLKGVNQ